ncbi:MAG: hypothetical protein WCI36_05690 [bacterium]
MSEFLNNHEFTPKQVHWKTKEVELQLVTFEVHESIKDLFHFEAEKQQPIETEISMEMKDKHIWEITISDGGTESYFFARMLFTALSRLKSGTVDLETLNCKLIEQYATSAAIRAKISALGFNARAKYDDKKEMYSVTLPVNSMVMTFANQNIDLLCKCIGLQLRDFLRPIRE